MQTEIHFNCYYRYGSPEILRALKYFVGFDRLIDCPAVKHLDIQINIRLPDCPEHLRGVFEDYESNLKEREVIRYLSSAKKLSIKYLSKLPDSSFDDFLEEGDRSYRNARPYLVESILNYRSKMAATQRISLSQEFEILVNDIYQLLSKNRKALIKKCGLDVEPLLKEIEANIADLPKDFESTWALIHRAQSWEAQRERIEEETPIHHNEPLPAVFKVNRMQPASMFIGKSSSDEQFWARVAVVHGFDEARQSARTWYAVLHRFTSDGDHIDTKIKRLGTNADNEKSLAVQAQFELDKFISELGDTTFGPISIKLFDYQFDGSEFGLQDTSTEEFGNEVTLCPGDIHLVPPWDGNYDFGMYTIDWMNSASNSGEAD